MECCDSTSKKGHGTPRRRQCQNLYRSSSRLSPTPRQVTHRNSSPPTHQEPCNSPQRTWHSHRRAIRRDESLPTTPATEKPSRDAYICAITEQFWGQEWLIIQPSQIAGLTSTKKPHMAVETHRSLTQSVFAVARSQHAHKSRQPHSCARH